MDPYTAMDMDTPEDESISGVTVASEDTSDAQPSSLRSRRMTRGMLAAGGVPPLVAAPARATRRVRKKPTVAEEEEAGVEDGNSPRSFPQRTSTTRKNKESSPDADSHWALNKNGVPDMEKLVRLLTRDYTKDPDESDLVEAAHKYKWRAVGPGKHTLWELRSITLTEKAEARKKLKENPSNWIAKVKLRVCEAVFSHVVSEWEVERHAKWSADLDKMKLN
ncbi:hypothetical protein B0T20DRAFT_484215 [Sordaria brevicollis]|uniref:Uncharacterized protein n=1 Tax=Sordaria brevicollis TaxID=83679 RepID=A0AAE0U2X2_SORBR|nr:hypothetical protein B0T20DRAFT_484215 [Sordaria brevicollis]